MTKFEEKLGNTPEAFYLLFEVDRFQLPSGYTIFMYLDLHLHRANEERKGWIQWQDRHDMYKEIHDYILKDALKTQKESILNGLKGADVDDRTN